MKNSSCWILILLSWTTASFAQQTTSKAPNIIVIFADDLGYGDLGFLGQQYIETPNIDRLASEGMFFRNHYS